MGGLMNDDDDLPGIRAGMDQVAALAKEWVPMCKAFYDALVQAGFRETFAEQVVLEYLTHLWNDCGDEE